jgi:small multidrug resistance pump
VQGGAILEPWLRPRNGISVNTWQPPEYARRVVNHQERLMLFGPYVSLVLAIFLGAIGQLALKGGAERASTLAEQLQQPLSILALALYGTATLFYMKALRSIPVSIAFPSVSASYVVVSLGAHVLWNEAFGVLQLVAILFICAGIFLLCH